jgi:hypothetical protein
MVVGLRLYMGEDVKSATEIMEVVAEFAGYAEKILKKTVQPQRDTEGV